MTGFSYRWASGTDVGRARDHNEDAVWPEGSGDTAEELVIAVADGMGGHIGGEIASSVAMEAAASAVGGGAEERVRIANLAVIDRILEQPRLAGMGTTLTLAVLGGDGSMDLAHIGDSRAYLLRDGTLQRLTRDHSLVAEMIESGELDPAAASSHPFRSVITRALGMERNVDVDTSDHRLEPGDRVLLCSDGLTNMVEEDDIAGIAGDAESPGDAVWGLIAAANQAGGIDNISVVAADAASDEGG